MEFLQEYIKIILTALFALLFLISSAISKKIIRSHAKKNNLDIARAVYISKFFKFILFILFSSFIAVTWDFKLQSLSVYFLSGLTILGVAIFASWSILSNVTASVILFFYYTYKIGAKVKIIDGDNSITGKIIDITLFYIKIQTEDGNIVSYPNNLALQKPIQQLQGSD